MSLDTLIKEIDKEFGTGALQKLSDRKQVACDVIPTGLSSVDNDVIGVGGIPRGRITEIYGAESCLVGNTFINFTVKQKDTITNVNSKGGTIEDLYNRFNNKTKHHLRAANDNVDYYAPSINEENRIFQNKIIDVVCTGEKECYRLTLVDGTFIEATLDHKFYTGTEYKKLRELLPGDKVFIHNNTRFEVEKYKAASNKQYIFVKNHGVAGKKTIYCKKVNKQYTYFRLLKSRAVAEAWMNSLTLTEYVDKLNTGDITGLKFLPRTQHVHHIDENILNNDISNLMIIDCSAHGKLHAVERHNNLRFVAVEATILSIEYVGKKLTYDLKMLAPFNNYVANRFVVHNSGKTTLALTVIAQAQKMGFNAALIDVEHALDPVWAKKIGVDVDSLLISQPDCGDDALKIVDAIVRSGEVQVVVVDSVAMLVPRAELEGEIGDANVGQQARLMSQAMRKLTGPVKTANTALIFINQIRDKIGVSFGSPTTTSGGRALKFAASLRLEVTRIGTIKKNEEPVANKVKIKAVKNKLSGPFKDCEVELRFDYGFDVWGPKLDAYIDAGKIVNKGAWFTIGDEKLQGRDNAIEWLKQNESKLQ